MHLIRYPESFSENAAKFLGETQRNKRAQISRFLFKACFRDRRLHQRRNSTRTFWCTPLLPIDALVIAAALEANAKILWSEDMHYGMIIDDRLEISNPFLAT